MELIYKQITDQNILSEYIDNFTRLVGVAVPREYFEANKVIGCFDSANILKGGYTINTNYPLRGLAVLPAKIKQESPAYKAIHDKKITEINGMWMCTTVKSLNERANFFQQIAKDLCRTNQQIVLVWYNQDNAYLARLYGRLKAHTLYEGPLCHTATVQTYKNVYIGYINISELQSKLPDAIKF